MNTKGTLYFAIISSIITIIGLIGYWHSLKKETNKSHSKIELNYIKLYKSYSKMFIFMGVGCLLMILLKIFFY